VQVRELVTRLGFDADTVAAQKYGKAVDDVRRVAQRAAIAMAGISTAATGLVWHFTNASSETLAWSNRLGIATDELQRLQFAASKYQISNKALIDGLKELSLRTDEYAKEGAGEAVEAFERLDLSARELNSVSGDTAELFRLVQSRISGIQNVSERQRIADELFGGEAGEQFTEFLGASGDEIERLGRLAEQTGSVVPRDVLERAREFSRETGTLQATVGGFGKVLAAELLPFYRELVELTQSWLQTNVQLIQQNIRLWVERLAFGVRTIASVVADFVGWVDELVESTIGWDKAIRLVLIGITGLISVKLAAWLWGVVSALSSMKVVLMAIKRIAIVAVITAIALAIEDLIVWIRGGDSALGKWLGSWESFRAKVGSVVNSVLDYIDPLIRQFKAMGDIFVAAFTLDKERVLSGLQDLGKAMVDWASQIGGDIRDAIASALPDWMITVLQKTGGAIQNVASGVRSVQNKIESGVGSAAGAVAPLFTGGAAAGGFTMPSRGSVQVNAKTEATLQVPQGTAEDQRRWLEMQAEKIFGEHWDRQINRALWDFQPVEG